MGAENNEEAGRRVYLPLLETTPAHSALLSPPPPPNEVKRGNLFPQSSGLVIHNQEPLSG